MIDVRCKSCNKLLFKAETCDIAMKCPRCREIFEYRVFNSMFVTSQYDPEIHEKSLRFYSPHDIMQAESDGDQSH